MWLRATWVRLVVLVSCTALVLCARPGDTSLSQSGQAAQGASALVESIAPKASTDSSASERIMAVGGSVADGWDDTTHAGYLGRAIDQISTTLNVPMWFQNDSIGGYTPEKLGDLYNRLLKSYRPSIVILSWGLLDDIASKTPESVFEAQIQNEVSLALDEGAQVWLITPPVTPASVIGRDPTLELQYARDEMQAAKSLHSKRVVVFDLLGSMKRYLAANHLNYKQYSSNGWHPNSAGHILAAQLLADAVIRRLGAQGILG